MATFSAAQSIQAQSAQAQTPHSSRRNNHMPRPGSVSHRQKLKKAALDSLSEEDEWAWGNFLSRCFHEKTGQNHINVFQFYTPIDDALANAFQDNTGPGPQGTTAYQLHFGAGHPQSRWNTAVIDNILEYAATDVEDECICHLDPDVQHAMLWDYIKQAQASWAHLNSHMADDRVETSEEAQAQAQDYQEGCGHDTHVTSRKYQKFHRRQKGLNLLLQAKRNPTELLQLQRTKLVLDALDVEGQSLEESGSEDTLIVTVPHYRRRVISAMMSSLDISAFDYLIISLCTYLVSTDS
ncbi:hypothetical protein F5050DRAFT_1906055 [Lentinula boryana]|uniref:Uncharacterized protein n=1 Tax=Lentinula boryana TaxID=40481 RepID=A0ABQ8PWJ5_9AGAR|nr:hypothetical protein F5050DRAFT_1906055 [Lentinula boryana]